MLLTETKYMSPMSTLVDRAGRGGPGCRQDKKEAYMLAQRTNGNEWYRLDSEVGREVAWKRGLGASLFNCVMPGVPATFDERFCHIFIPHTCTYSYIVVIRDICGHASLSTDIILHLCNQAYRKSWRAPCTRMVARYWWPRSLCGREQCGILSNEIIDQRKDILDKALSERCRESRELIWAFLILMDQMQDSLRNWFYLE